MSKEKVFNVGDRIIANNNLPNWRGQDVQEGTIGYVVYMSSDKTVVCVKWPHLNEIYYAVPKDLELLEKTDKSGGIEKPILEERKADKIRMELVDQGFPLAFLEIAKVMTWANKNKGYKDHDWKQIPDAENAFKGAAARHRVKFDAQRSFGMEMLSCTDEESNIIHLAHECFNNLALLELALSGKIK